MIERVGRPPARLIALAAIIAAAVGCRRQYEFDPWLLPVPAGTTQVGHWVAGVRDSAPPSIDLVEELVIGRDSDEGEVLLGRSPALLAVADDSRVYVLDPSNQRVLAYDPAGEYLATLGRQGQGPGELSQPVEIFITDDVIHVWDVVNRRVSRWRLDGELIEGTATGQWGRMIVPVSGGELVWRASERTSAGRDIVFRRVTIDGEQLVQYARMPWPARVIDPPLAQIANAEPDTWWVGTVPPAFAASADGDVYVSPFEQYQVFAFAPDGTMRWALQADRERLPLSQVEIDFHMEYHARRFPDRIAAQIDWPAREYAIGDIKIDGHGHIYVFPYMAKGTPPEVPRPVDVYTADGALVYSGLIRGRLFSTAFATYNGPMLEVAWQVARGDRIWGLAEESESGEREVVVYRIVEPF